MTAAVIVVLVLVLWIAPMFAAHSLGKRRNREGFIYAFWLGWLGVILLACQTTLPAEETAS